ncbi:MAG TPA: hypothetical protein VFN10_20940 [Thermoanaerobaculia bacterium]|nr:hypothetical protein [Thermoanaerobaculia bacterium]
MQCAECDREIPDDGLICLRCDAPVSSVADASEPSHRDLASAVRRLKGLVVLSFFFGAFVAPFALYIATTTLHRFAGDTTADRATLRQLVLLRRIAIGLLIFWIVLIAARLRWLATRGA